MRLLRPRIESSEIIYEVFRMEMLPQGNIILFCEKIAREPIIETFQQYKFRKDCPLGYYGKSALVGSNLTPYPLSAEIAKSRIRVNVYHHPVRLGRDYYVGHQTDFPHIEMYSYREFLSRLQQEDGTRRFSIT